MGIKLFARWLLYPLTAIVCELPNMAVIYYIHWQQYKTVPQAPVKIEFAESEYYDEHALEPTLEYDGSS
jgi:hypothetical protein